MELTKLFKEFFESEKAGGLLLLICTVISMIVANSSLQVQYLSIWNFNIADHSLAHWINDGLMAIFFLLIGLELEREIYKGELSNIKNAMLPIFSAIGGIVVPASIHLALNFGTETQGGAGIPMATDIAFAIGILSLLGKRVPLSLKVFLTALAVIDDLCAILTIAIFYSKDISILNLGLAGAVFAILLILNRLKVRTLIPYIIGGLIMWFFMYKSGVHATISGVLLAFAIPFGDGSEKSPSYKLQHFLHKPVALFILPIFALANTCIVIESNWTEFLTTANSIGISLGLLLGKPIGITLFGLIAVLFKIAKLPEEINFKMIAGVGFLGGIGFTMSIFITLLAFDNQELVTASKIAVLLASFTAGVIGLLWLRVVLKKLR